MTHRPTWARLTVAVILGLLLSVLVACGGGATPAPTKAPTQPPAKKEATKAQAAKPTPAKKKLKVAFVYVAPIGDLGWTWAHDQGRKAIEKAFGDQVETAYIENVPEGPEAERVIRDFAQKGYDIIFTTSFGFMDPTITVAKEFPDKWFIHISGYKTAPNVSTVFGRMYQPRYLSGLVAGSMTKSNIIGYVAAFPIPEVIRGINAFTLGVRAVNPKAEVRVVWTNTWFGPPQEKEAAEALLSEGADVIAQHQDTTEPQKAAKDAGALGIGYDSDMRKFVGDTVLTSPVWNWGVKYVDIVRKVMEGTYKSESYWGGMKDGIVDLAPFSPLVPEKVRKLVEEKKQLILSGKWDVFCGPIKGQNGKLVVPEGKCLSDEEMLSMKWFVEGVKGKAPEQPPESAGQKEAPAGAPTPKAQKPQEFIFGMVLVGPHNDHGWSEAHYTAGKYVEEKVPGTKMIWLESLNSADRPETTLEQVVDDMVSRGAKLIFTTSDAFEKDTIPVAKKYPDVVFINISGDDVLTGKAPPNEGNIMGYMVPMKGVAGCAAALATETGTIGYLGPLINFETRRLASAAYLGARYCYEKYRGKDPNDLRFIVTWIGFWFNIPGVTLDPTEVANNFFDSGADVVISGIDTTEALVVAKQRAAQGQRVFAIPYDYAGACKEAPDVCLGIPYFNWGPAYVKTVKAVMNGTWKQSWDWVPPDWNDINNRDTTGTGFVFGPALTDEWKADLQEFIQGLASGDIVLFKGPLKLQDGTVYLKEGEVATPKQIWYLPKLLEGMEGPSE